MPDVRIADWAIARLAEKPAADTPFFLAVGFCRPHVPMYAPPRYWAAIPEEKDIRLPAVLAGDRDDVPEYGRRLTHGMPAPRHPWFVENDQWRTAVRAYLACVHFVDHQVGRVLAALDRSPHADNTIVVLCSDHGFHLGEKQRWAKRSLWTRSTRVPLVVAPARAAAASWRTGTPCRRPVGLIDLYPTLLSLCSLPADPGAEGHSLEPLLRAPDAALAPRRADHAVPRQPQRAHGPLALHALRRRLGGALRPRGRSPRVAQPGEGEGAPRGRGRAPPAPASRERRAGRGQPGARRVDRRG